MSAKRRTSTTARPTAARQPAPQEAPSEYRIADWSGVPNYGCPFCPFATLEGDALVVAHIAARHRPEPAQEV